MRIQIIGNNDCARATRHLLRQAGFAASDGSPDEVRGGIEASGKVHAGYAIAIEVAPPSKQTSLPRGEPSSPALAANPPESAVRDPHTAPAENARGAEARIMTAEPSFTPGPATHDQPAPGQEETSAALPPAADVSSPALRPETPPMGGRAIHFDSVESALETAVLRHVTRLWYGVVTMDRPGGRVHNERELRIVVPAENGAAAKAVEFGVLRGMLDLSHPSPQPVQRAKEAESKEAGKGAGSREAEKSAEKKPEERKRGWRNLFGLLMVLAVCAPCLPVAQAAPTPRPRPALSPAPASSPSPAQIAAWRVGFALAGALGGSPAEPQGQQPGGAMFDSVYDSGNTALKVNCVVGCSATSGFSDNSAFSVGSTAINLLGAYYTTGSAPSISSGNAGRLRMDGNSYLYVDCVTGCSSSSNPSFGSAFPSTGLAVGATNGTDLEPLQVNGSGYLETLLENSSIAATQSGSWSFSCSSGCYQTTQPVSWSGQSVSLTGSWPYSGTLGAVTQASGPWTQNITQWDSTALGAPSNYGTSPGAVAVPGVNAYVTNTVPVTGTFYQATQPVSAASLPLPSGASTSADQCGYSGSNCNVIGTLSDNGAAATGNRVGVLPGIAESTVPSAETAGRDTAIATNLQRQALVSQVPEDSFASYEAAGTVSSASSATDIAVLSGNATNTVMVTRVVVTCTQTTAGIITLNLIKRSSADSSGTSSSLTAVPMDSNYSAADSAAKVYTANPTTGTGVGNIDVADVGCMATSTTSPNDIYILNLWQKPIVLRGTAQQLVVNLGGTTVSGGSFTVRFEWIETANL